MQLPPAAAAPGRRGGSRRLLWAVLRFGWRRVGAIGAFWWLGACGLDWARFWEELCVSVWAPAPFWGLVGCFPGVPKHSRPIWREFEFSQLCKMTVPLERAGSCARPCLLVGRCWRPLTLDESFRERSGGGAGFGEQSQILAGQRTASILGHVRRSLNGFPFVRFHWLRVPGWSCVLDLCKKPSLLDGCFERFGPRERPV